MMWSAFVHGVGFGFTLSLLIGPVFFALLHTSIANGFRAGWNFALGVLTSDLVLIVCALSLASFIEQHPKVNNGIIVVGSIGMCIMGLYYFLSKPTVVDAAIENNLIPRKKSYFRGFLLNFLTPTVLFFWIGTCSFVTVTYVSSTILITLFFIGCLGTLLAMDLLKSYLALRIKPILTVGIIKFIQQLLGVLLFLAGLYALAENIWKR